ncbi:conserved Plasmodium protein, unknown function [Plasmodium vivax]|uniref:Uncharacterized protein n=5 Tax=Plasmodium vivax TaxID=5855 RepID=A5K5B8_PLAVS|nr:hypothetical protein PVX_092905 [Plasmodium vivax]KMZ86445.1 hypothetical protein PVBG_05313 [Plasmodium vivax Brazil I]KMZ92865.1 hypothetical protein PVMG_05425 [Plasmodium vivax Mauritania I]KMZ99378.1 hypothetical protein PVNG_05746 [Plasmodium vivax North Korean]EDL45846.1 hypothetical protein PVX_092905 [Plasmodium vivax]CAG9477261.1 unnamed protein product [Plasmodium vivax]|eukprot:XP_001615573.1 hypothetical protein [Plasmodium vivax Sal-1]
MHFLNFATLSAFLIAAYTFCATENDPSFCKKTHRGILKYHKKKDPQEYFTVSAVLKNDTLDFYRGSTIYDTIDLTEVVTPLAIFSTSPECMTVNMANKDAVVLCCNTEECINNWWLFLTKQILCLNSGEMRNESDEKTLEDVQHNIISNNNFDGVSINIQQGLEDIPNVVIKAES